MYRLLGMFEELCGALIPETAYLQAVQLWYSWSGKFYQNRIEYYSLLVLCSFSHFNIRLVQNMQTLG